MEDYEPVSRKIYWGLTCGYGGQLSEEQLRDYENNKGPPDTRSVDCRDPPGREPTERDRFFAEQDRLIQEEDFRRRWHKGKQGKTVRERTPSQDANLN